MDAKCSMKENTKKKGVVERLKSSTVTMRVTGIQKAYIAEIHRDSH